MILKVVVTIFICGIFEYMLTILLQDPNCKGGTALSILVLIVNISVIAACFLDLYTEHLYGHDFRNLGHKIANLELLKERH